MRIAVASSYGLPGREIERAHDAGLRTFFWGALRHDDFGRALRRLARIDRAGVTIATVSYARQPILLRASLDLARRRLGVDRLDLVVLGYVHDGVPPRLRDAALTLRDRGVIGALGVSSHDRTLLASLASTAWPDAIMTRYSAAHPGAEREVFPHVGGKRLLTYTATRWGTLIDPSRIPSGERVPTATDCYRFVLSDARVDLCLSGPRDGNELDAAIAAANLGALSEDENAWMRRVGAAVRASAEEPAPRGDLGRRVLRAARSLFTRGITEDVVSRLNR